jgi:uncharacterized protein YndB with AHSA1/START domain
MSTMHPLGEILRDDSGALSLRFERRMSHPPVRVWRAITESDQLRYWMPCDIVGPREQGAAIVVPFWDDVAEKYSIEEPILTGRIVTWDPPHRFAWEWDDERLTFDLEPVDGGTVLTLTVRLGSKGPGADRVGAGYHRCLDQLVTLVENDDAPPFLSGDGTEFEPLYADLLARLS